MRFSENFEAAKNIAVEAAQTAAAKAKELAAVAKANISIYAEEDKVKKAEIELGKLYYRDYAVGEELKDFIASLREDEAPAETEAAPTDDDFEIVVADDEPKADETPAVEAPKTEEAPAEEAPAEDAPKTEE